MATIQQWSGNQWRDVEQPSYSTAPASQSSFAGPAAFMQVATPRLSTMDMSRPRTVDIAPAGAPSAGSANPAWYTASPSQTANTSWAMPTAPVAPPRVAAAAAPAALAGVGGAASIAAPTSSQYQYNNPYPTYMRNIGENQAQQRFQTAVNQGIRLGNAPQAYQAAMDARNQNRLQYMAQAGQAQFGIDQAQAAALDAYQRNVAQLYATQVQQKAAEDARKQQELATLVSQRGQDLGYLSNIYGGDVSQRGQDIGLMGSVYGQQLGYGSDMANYANRLAIAHRIHGP